MDAKNNYIGTPTLSFCSVELLAFGQKSRFLKSDTSTVRMFDEEWANTELIPLLHCAYSHLPHVGRNHDFWKDLDEAELFEPWHMVCLLIFSHFFVYLTRVWVASHLVTVCTTLTQEQPDYPVADSIFIERLRLALLNPGPVMRPSRLANIIEDMPLVIRLLLRRYVLHGGAFRLASLGMHVNVGMAQEVADADAVDCAIAMLFAHN